MRQKLQLFISLIMLGFISNLSYGQSCDGGTVSTAAGDTTEYTCPGDGNADEIMFAHMTSSTDNYAYVVTDPSGNILGLPPGNMVNFEGAGSGTCLVWGLSYTGNITVSVGDNALSSALTDSCYDLSSNFVSIIRDTPDGGMVSTAAGDTVDYTCPGDGNADELMFAHVTGSNSKYAYVVTDLAGNILGLPPGNMVNFEGAGSGTCLVWGLSYTGNITASMGDNALSVALSDDCFDLSDNYVSVIRDTPDGGMISTAAGDTVDYTCPGDGNADELMFAHVTGSNSKYAYVVTDLAGNILGLPPGNMVNFEGAGSGTCLVWGLSYTGNITASMGDNALSVALSDDCFDLSDNYVSVIRDTPDGGMVSTAAGDTVDYTCPGDGNADELMFAHVTGSNSKYAYVVTDLAGNILGLPPGNMVNFEGAGSGTCLVWGLSYTGNITASMGDNALSVALSDDCFDLSDNYVSVIRDTPDGGMVSTAAGDTVDYTCPGDGNADELMFAHVTGSNSKYAYVVTDLAGNILGLPPGNMVNFEGAGSGTCLVWGLSYTGNITASMGDNALSVALSDDCFDLSDNYVSVIRDTPDGGMVSTAAGDTVEYTCPGDGNADELMFAHVTGSNSKYAYVVTDLAGNILGLPPGNMVNFEGAGSGTCLVWGLSYTGNITASMGDNALSVALSDDCFDLSDNYVSVIRDTPDGGTVSTVDGVTEVYTCAGDGDDDKLMFAHVTGSNSKYAYVVTDLAGNILGLPPGNMVNFEGAGAGTCLVWGLSYTGNITAQAGDNALAIALTDDCFDLSANYITVVRNTDCVTDFTLINAQADTDIGPLQDGDIIDLNLLASNKLNVRANVTGSNVESVLFGFDGNANFKVENKAPYALKGDNNGNYKNLILAPGVYTLTASPFDQNGAQGNMGTPLTITFTVIDSDDEVTGFTLVDAQTNMDIATLNDGDVIDVNTIASGQFNIRANTTSIVGSVRFGVNSNANAKTENKAPYALGGDTNGNYKSLNWAPGMYTITATPYSKKNANGQAGISNTITVTVVGSTSSSRTSLNEAFSFYPNPFTSQITVSLDKVEAGNVEISLYSVDGRLVKSESFPTKMAAFSQDIQVGDLPAGVYVIKVNTETYQTTKRLVKE